MGRKVSEAETEAQIAEYGAPFGLLPMRTAAGSLVVGELVPMKIPLGCGISILEDVARDVCEMTPDYPFAYVLRGRRRQAERSFWARMELRNEINRKASAQKRADAYHELGNDMRKADRGRIILTGG